MHCDVNGENHFALEFLKTDGKHEDFDSFDVGVAERPSSIRQGRLWQIHILSSPSALR